MSTKALFGRYWPASSSIHKLDPRSKILATLSMVFITLLAQNLYALIFLFLCLAAFCKLARLPLKCVAQAITPLLFIVVLTMLFNVVFIQEGEILATLGPLIISSRGLYMAVFTGLRLTLLLSYGSFLTLTTTSIDITQGIENLLKPFAHFGFPGHELAFIIGIALRFLPEFVIEFQSIQKAQNARGAEFPHNQFRGLNTISCLLVPLFTGIFRHADTLANAMDARCYHGAVGRTRLHPLRYSKADAKVAIVIPLLLMATILLSLFASY